MGERASGIERDMPCIDNKRPFCLLVAVQLSKCSYAWLKRNFYTFYLSSERMHLPLYKIDVKLVRVWMVKMLLRVSSLVSELAKKGRNSKCKLAGDQISRGRLLSHMFWNIKLSAFQMKNGATAITMIVLFLTSLHPSHKGVANRLSHAQAMISRGTSST